MICPNCQSQTDGGAFCDRCGAALPAVPAAAYAPPEGFTRDPGSGKYYRLEAAPGAVTWFDPATGRYEQTGRAAGQPPASPPQAQPAAFPAQPAQPARRGGHGLTALFVLIPVAALLVGTSLAFFRLGGLSLFDKGEPGTRSDDGDSEWEDIVPEGIEPGNEPSLQPIEEWLAAQTSSPSPSPSSSPSPSPSPSPSLSPPPSPSPSPSQAPAPSVGSLVAFGDYEWRVLAVENGKALIITDKIIDFRAYHNTYEPITWADCDLRAYLNGEFYNGFSANDKAKIAETRNVNKDNQWYGTPGGADTTDKIFLLSLEEAAKYFGDSGQLADRPSGAYWIDDQCNNARIAYTAKAVPGYESDYPAGTAWSWWLRSSGRDSDSAAIIDNVGYMNVNGRFVNYSGHGLRPALWITP